ncbi:MAG: CCA tRNA nucleotidyltransferase [Beijerinckiaceae bacterium]
MKLAGHLPDAGLFARGAVGRLLGVLNGAGEETRVVGGAVRNALMGLPIHDIDCATTALPDVVTARSQQAGFHVVPTGVDHGTVTVVVDGTPFEVTTLRRDVETNGRHARVIFGRDFSEDAARRDFTMNALMANTAGEIFDAHDGVGDIARRQVRFIGDPVARIREDFLRILRLFRFHAAYGHGALDAQALSAAIRERAGLAQLSRERVRAELMKTLVAPRASETLAIMSDCGIAQRVLGGVAYPVRLRFARPGQDAAIRLGLVAVEAEPDAQRLREALRLSNDEHARVLSVARIATALRALAFKPDARDLRVLIYREGAAMRSAILSVLASGAALNEVLKRAYDLMLWEPPVLPFSGADLLAQGITPGPRIGHILTEAERRWVAADFPADCETRQRILDDAIAAV